MTPRVQKFLLTLSAAFAICATLYAFNMSLQAWIIGRNWVVLAVWFAIVVAYVPFLYKLFMSAWSLVDKVSERKR